MGAEEALEPLQRMFSAMNALCISITGMRARYGRWNVPVSKAECTIVWFALGVRPEPGAHWARFPAPSMRIERKVRG